MILICIQNLVYFYQQLTDSRDHLVHAPFRKLIQDMRGRFLIAISRLDSLSNNIRDFRFKFPLESIEGRSYLAILDCIPAGAAVNGIAFDIVH